MLRIAYCWAADLVSLVVVAGCSCSSTGGRGRHRPITPRMPPRFSTTSSTMQYGGCTELREWRKTPRTTARHRTKDGWTGRHAHTHTRTRIHTHIHRGGGQHDCYHGSAMRPVKNTNNKETEGCKTAHTGTGCIPTAWCAGAV